jgi:methylenetetrahydrofolate--tRNA-(uracil-5-)-methyltransferase
MNVNFGLMPPPDEATKKKDRKLAYTARARVDFARWRSETGAVTAS